jgi:hypothetical protein
MSRTTVRLSAGRILRRPLARRPRADRKPGRSGKAAFRHCLHAEWIKIRTMRSTLYVILGTLAFCLGLAALNC